MGANARYAITRLAENGLGAGWPWGTLIVNLIGCVVVGAAATLISARLIARPDELRLFLVVGFLGSLTTFSAFAYETHGLMQQGAWGRALLNVGLSVVAGIAGVRLGVLLTPGLRAFFA